MSRRTAAKTNEKVRTELFFAQPACRDVGIRQPGPRVSLSSDDAHEVVESLDMLEDALLWFEDADDGIRHATGTDAPDLDLQAMATDVARQAHLLRSQLG